ncbi:MAG: DUF512 domain-containing protein, partial [Armatimonadota bacterium]
MAGIIAAIEPGSIAEELGWHIGDEIISINGRLLRDVIDYRFYCSDQHLRVVLRRRHARHLLRASVHEPGSRAVDPGESLFVRSAFGRGEKKSSYELLEYDIEKDIDTSLGVEFSDILFDGVRTCAARCIFCFVDQLPKGLRKPLYLKDDDYRLSFLDGNFITLTNVNEEDIDRIIEQRLSPLYISVHATDRRVRERLMGKRCPDILEQIDALSAGRITLHTQIVLCRGINDGWHLDQTINDLAGRYPTVASIAIVPAGVTRHRRSKFPLQGIDVEYSRQILNTIRQHQQQFLVKKGTRLVWAADEFYLSAGRPVPARPAYEGFPQLSNGVGLVRLFKDSGAYSLRRLRAAGGVGVGGRQVP